VKPDLVDLLIECVDVLKAPVSAPEHRERNVECLDKAASAPSVDMPLREDVGGVSRSRIAIGRSPDLFRPRRDYAVSTTSEEAASHAYARGIDKSEECTLQ
jgi:hypothetical protein